MRHLAIRDFGSDGFGRLYHSLWAGPPNCDNKIEGEEQMEGADVPRTTTGEWMVRAARGEEGAKDRFLAYVAERIAIRIRKLVASRFPNLKNDVALVHNIFLERITRKLAIDPPTSGEHFWNWLDIALPGTVRDEAEKNARRARRERPSGSMDDSDDIPVADGGPGPDRVAEVYEIYDKVLRAINRLPDSFRLVVLACLGEASIAETARDLGISPDAARQRLHRARELLCEDLQIDDLNGFLNSV